MRLHPAGLNAGDVKQRGDQLGQPEAIAVNDLDLLAHLFVEIICFTSQFSDRALNQGERRAKLMADIGEKHGLGVIEFGQLFGAMLLGGVGTGAGDAGGDVTGHQPHEGAVVLTQWPVAVQSGNQKPDRSAARSDQGNDRRPGGRLRPCTGGYRDRGGVKIDDHAAAGGGLPDRPHRRVVAAQFKWCRNVPRGQTAAGGQPRTAGGVQQVGQRERQVFLVALQLARGESQHFPFGAHYKRI